ncbi:hypothetical protein SLA2020_254750 [Shorea laevis]
MWRKFEEDESFSNETPFDPIISFFQVKLYNHVTILAFPFGERIDKFLQNKNIICAFPSRNEASLTRRDNRVKNWFHPINKDF